MMRFVMLAAVLGMAATLVGGARAGDDAEKGKGKDKRAGAAVFKRLDANSDGKITPDEFKKLGERAKGKLKDRPELSERLFKRLDANNDGSLSEEEAKKLGEGLKGKRSPKP